MFEFVVLAVFADYCVVYCGVCGCLWRCLVGVGGLCCLGELLWIFVVWFELFC